jgi:hypothetical protein
MNEASQHQPNQGLKAGSKGMHFAHNINIFMVIKGQLKPSKNLKSETKI